MLPRVILHDGGAIRGKSLGAAILSMFGALWFWLAAVNSGRPVLSPALTIASAAGALLMASSSLYRLGKRFAPPPRQPQVARAFLLVNVAEWLVGVAAVVLLIRAGAEDYAPAAIALVVGLHFYPLAYLFRAPVQYLTGTALVALAVIFNRHYLPVFIGSGITLWSTAVYQLVAGFRLAKSAAARAGAGLDPA